ncbi:MAG: sensor histidine kinase [Comamonas sp.]
MLPTLSSYTLRRALAAAAIAAGLVAIFVLDTLTEYAVAVAVFHSVLILLAVRWFSARAVVALTLLCIALTLLSFALTPAGIYHLGLINTCISIVAIAVTAYLGLKLVAARAAAHAAQARLAQLAQATSVGELAGSIAHEVNQPLAAIVTSGHACQRWLAQEPPQLERAGAALARMLADAERASNVITRIRGAARGELPQRTRFALNDALREIAAMSEDELQRGGVALQLQLAPELPPAWADRVQVQQVAGNLLLNAIDAVRSMPAGARQIVLRSSLADAGMLRLQVMDSGPGVPPAAMPHLFEAFWTTKRRGLGLGLNISRNLVEANGGSIAASARNDGKGGAQFEVLLPSVSSAAAQEGA